MNFAAAIAAADGAALTHLGGAVRYRPGVGDPVDVTGIFDAVYVRADAGMPGVMSSGPAVMLKLADLPLDPEDDVNPEVVVAGVVYTVREAKKDGMGVVVLLLNEA